MSFDISSENDITITRGDTAEFELSLFTDEGEPYICKDDDVIEFTVKKHLTDRTVMIHKSIPKDTLILFLSSDDTEGLVPGEYRYDISLTDEQYKNTFIENRRFVVVPKI